MVSDEHLRIIQFFLGLGVFWGWYVFMYRRTRTDRLREDLFTMRDQLFDYMWQHGLSYDLSAYQQMRDFLNGGIRFADRLNLIPLLLVAYLVRDVRPYKDLSLPKAIQEIDDPTTRIYFEKMYHKAGRRLYRRVFLEGFYWPLCKPVQYVRRARALPPIRENSRFQSMSEDLMRWGRRMSPEARVILLTFRSSMWRRRGHV